MIEDLKHIWDARAHIIDNIPTPILGAFMGAVIGDATVGTAGMIVASSVGAVIASKIEDTLTGRHAVQTTTYNSDDPEHALEENGRVIARLISPATASVCVGIASTLG